MSDEVSICLNNGATLVFAHHTSGPPQYGATPKLSWLAFSGFKQFVFDGHLSTADVPAPACNLQAPQPSVGVNPERTRYPHVRHEPRP